MDNTADGYQDRTECRVAGAAEAEDFASNAVFLGCKCERHKGGCAESGVRGGGEVKVLAASREADIGKAKRCGFRRIGGVFARVK